jgi:cell wall-associated NlpC family hydrolase
MQPLFNNEKYWSKYEQVLRSWLGTPYRHKQCTKGYGTDCTLFIGDSLKECGILRKVDTPKYYPKDWFNSCSWGNLMAQQMEHNFKHNCRGGITYEVFFEEETPEPIAGDICLFSMRPGTGIANHGCVLLSMSTMIHVSQRSNVRLSPYGSTWRNMQTITFRLMEI